MKHSGRKKPAAQDFYAENLHAEIVNAQQKAAPGAQEKPLAELARLVREHPGKEHLAEAYGSALFYRCVTLCEADAVAAATRECEVLLALQKSRPENLSLAQSAALALFALWGMNDYTDKAAARKALRDLQWAHRSDAVIDGVMEDLCKAEQRDELEQVLLPMLLHDLEVLRKSCEQNPDDTAGAECYAELLCTTATCQAALWPEQAAAAAETTEALRAFAAFHPQSKEIAWWYKKLRKRLKEARQNEGQGP